MTLRRCVGGDEITQWFDAWHSSGGRRVFDDGVRPVLLLRRRRGRAFRCSPHAEQREIAQTAAGKRAQ
jgi:hypothetical protein